MTTAREHAIHRGMPEWIEKWETVAESMRAGDLHTAIHRAVRLARSRPKGNWNLGKVITTVNILRAKLKPEVWGMIQKHGTAQCPICGEDLHDGR